MLLEQGKTEEDVIKALLGVSEKISCLLLRNFSLQAGKYEFIILFAKVSIGSGQ